MSSLTKAAQAKPKGKNGRVKVQRRAPVLPEGLFSVNGNGGPRLMVSKRTQFMHAVKSIEKMPKPMELLGLGACIAKTLNIALYVDAKHKYPMTVRTASIPCTDDVIPDDEDLPFGTRSRLASAIIVRFDKPKG
jgi:hypothetical protein